MSHDLRQFRGLISELTNGLTCEFARYLSAALFVHLPHLWTIERNSIQFFHIWRGKISTFFRCTRRWWRIDEYLLFFVIDKCKIVQVLSGTCSAPPRDDKRLMLSVINIVITCFFSLRYTFIANQPV